jgi:molybdate transport system substrate-binding protein
MRLFNGQFKRLTITGALSCVAVLTVTALAPAALADEVTLLASNAVREPYVEILPDFEKATGHRVVVDWGATVDIVKRASDGEAADILIIPHGRVDDLIKRGVVVDRVDLARSGIGVAGRADAPRPALLNAEDLKRALVAAKSVVLSSGPSSAHMLALFEKMGIADEVKPKLIQLAPGLSVGEAIAEGKGEIGFTQISELLLVKGINYMGPLPPEIQVVTTFSAGLLAAARSPDAARALIRFLSGPSAGPVLRKHGMDPGWPE